MVPAKTYIVGLGMTQFLKPESHSFDYYELAADSVRQALADASVDFS